MPESSSTATAPDATAYLTTLPNEPLAQMWAETLRREGIPVLVKPQGPGFAAWGSSFSLDHDLYVHATDLAAAHQLMADLLADDEPMPPESPSLGAPS